jgi:hypothetical protein
MCGRGSAGQAHARPGCWRDKRSPGTLQKLIERTLDDGSPVHSFRTLSQELTIIVRNTCVTRSTKGVSPSFQMITTFNTTKHRAMQLLQQITV